MGDLQREGGSCYFFQVGTNPKENFFSQEGTNPKELGMFPKEFIAVVPYSPYCTCCARFSRRIIQGSGCWTRISRAVQCMDFSACFSKSWARKSRQVAGVEAIQSAGHVFQGGHKNRDTSTVI